MCHPIPNLLSFNCLRFLSAMSNSACLYSCLPYPYIDCNAFLSTIPTTQYQFRNINSVISVPPYQFRHTNSAISIPPYQFRHNNSAIPIPPYQFHLPLSCLSRRQLFSPCLFSCRRKTNFFSEASHYLVCMKLKEMQWLVRFLCVYAESTRAWHVPTWGKGSRSVSSLPYYPSSSSPSYSSYTREVKFQACSHWFQVVYFQAASLYRGDLANIRDVRKFVI